MAARQDPPDFLADAAQLILRTRAATLATVHEGAPYAALVTPASLPDGAFLLLLSTLSAHTRHLQANPACALLLTGPPTSENPQTAPRVTISGLASLSPDRAARDIYLACHPYAALYVDFADFAFWRIDPAQAHYVGGFAAASSLEIAALQQEIIAQRRLGHG
jgi:putative heme iron utilization protein